MKPIYQSTHNVMLKAFLLMFVCTVFHFVVPMEVSAQTSQFGDMFKDSSNVSSQSQQKFDEAASGLIWWIKKAGILIAVISATVIGIMVICGIKPFSELIKPGLVAVLIGGGIQILIQIFFEVGSKAAN